MEILSISPAGMDWEAAFVEEGKLVFYSVACWGVAEVIHHEHDARSKHAVGLVSMPGVSELMVCEEYRNFLGYLAPGEDPDIYLPTVEEYLENESHHTCPDCGHNHDEDGNPIPPSEKPKPN